MRLATLSILTALLVAAVSFSVNADHRVRIATYNIKFLSTDVAQQGDRLANLRRVIELLDADVIGLQEIDDRAALELLFPPDRWHLVIDDDSGDDQDVAVVVRKPLRVLDLDADLDADDRHFLFAGAAHESFFPNRRDLLCVEVQDERDARHPVSLFVLVHHAKARRGGRANTDARREGASAQIANVLESARFDDKRFVLLGDMNDAPDDKSLNILETGNPAAAGGPEEVDGPFLMNLAEPLWAAGHVSFGRDANNLVGVDAQRRVNTVDPNARNRNERGRGTNRNTGDILFDQMLIPMHMADDYVGGSARVFDHEIAVSGSAQTRASDHLPVFADFAFVIDEAEDPASPGTPRLRIASVLPNPSGADEGHEQVTLVNAGTRAVDLSGWALKDRAERRLTLLGTVEPGQAHAITLRPGGLVLTNSGDDLLLLDPAGRLADRVSYTASQARSGRVIEFPR